MAALLSNWAMGENIDNPLLSGSGAIYIQTVLYLYFSKKVFRMASKHKQHEDMTLKELQVELKNRGAKWGGRKQDLVQRCVLSIWAIIREIAPKTERWKYFLAHLFAFSK